MFKRRKDTEYKALIKCYNDDFHPKTPLKIETFKMFETLIINDIKNCGRSIDEQQVEAIAKIERIRHDYTGFYASMFFSFAAIVGSYYIAEMDTGWVTKVSLLILILLLIIAFFSYNKHKLREREVSTYFTVKLYFIEKIKKESETKEILKVKNSNE